VGEAFARCGVQAPYLVSCGSSDFITSDKQSGHEFDLHTQPESYQAIKLYNDFGFNMTKKDCYGHAINEYEAAIDVLREVMSAEEFKKLIDSTVE